MRQHAASPRSAALPRARAAWLWVHRWLGLTVGLAMALIGLSGALLVVDGPLWRLEFPRIMAPLAPPGGGEPAPVADWIEAARRARPDLGAPEFVMAAGVVPLPGEAAIVGRETDLGGGHGHLVVAVDPWRAEALGSFVLEETWAGLPVLVHTTLLLPFVGLEIVAWSGALMALSAATGLYLFWPRRGGWRRALRPVRRAPATRRWLELHGLPAFYLLPALLAVAVSGIYLTKPGWLDPVVALAAPIPPAPEPVPLRADAARCGGPTSLPAAVAAAEAAVPGASFRFLLVPAAAGAPYQVGLHRPGDQNWRSGDSEVWIDRSCPQALAARTGRDRTAGERLKLAMLPVHDGTYFGAAGEALVFATGLLLPALYATGVVVWWRRRGVGRRAAFRRGSSAPSG